MKDQKLLGEESELKLLIKYSVPAIIGMLVNALYNIFSASFLLFCPNFIEMFAVAPIPISIPKPSNIDIIGIVIPPPVMAIGPTPGICPINILSTIL